MFFLQPTLLYGLPSALRDELLTCRGSERFTLLCAVERDVFRIGVPSAMSGYWWAMPWRVSRELAARCRVDGLRTALIPTATPNSRDSMKRQRDDITPALTRNM